MLYFIQKYIIYYISAAKSIKRIKAVEKTKKSIPLLESMGEVSAAYVSIYPPGIPLLTPGEKISERCVRHLQNAMEEGLEIHGLSANQEIEIVWEEFFT